MSNDQTSDINSISENINLENNTTEQTLSIEQVEKLQEEIDLLTSENQDLDDEISFAEENLKKLQTIVSKEQALINEEKQLEGKLTALTETVESLLCATEAMEETGLLENAQEFSLKEEEKADEEIKSLRSEIEDKQKILAQLRNM